MKIEYVHTPEIRRLLDRVEALDLAAAIVAPVGDRAFATGCIDRWQQIVRGLVDPDGSVLGVLRGVDGDAAALVEHLERRDPSPPLAAVWTLEWAECPLDLLVDPAVPDDEESLDCHGYYHGGLTWTAAPGIDRLVGSLRDGRLRPELVPPRRADPRAAYTAARSRFVVEMLCQLVGGIVHDVLRFASLHPTFGDNPYEPELALLERGLFPLGSSGGVCHVFRPAPVGVVVPAWLPYFTPAR